MIVNIALETYTIKYLSCIIVQVTWKANMIIVYLLITDRYNFLKIKGSGPVRESNPGPRAPEARIIPLDQQAMAYIT